MKLSQAILEIRYPSAYRCFDHAGGLMEQIVTELPNWALTKAGPLGLSLVRGAQGLSCNIGIDASAVIQSQTDDIFDLENGKAFQDDVLPLLSAVVGNYRITELSRIGYRRVYSLGFEDPGSALAAWNNLPFLKFDLPEGVNTQRKPGDICLNLALDGDVNVRFAVNNIDFDLDVGGHKVGLSAKKIYKLPSGSRKKALESLLLAEKKFKHLPTYGLHIDFDFFREDLLTFSMDDIGRFMKTCEEKEPELVRSLLKGSV